MYQPSFWRWRYVAWTGPFYSERSDGTPRSAAVRGRQGNNRDTGLRELTDAEISSRARDKSLPRTERRRYQREEKCRGLRNRRKVHGR